MIKLVFTAANVVSLSNQVCDHEPVVTGIHLNNGYKFRPICILELNVSVFVCMCDVPKTLEPLALMS